MPPKSAHTVKHLFLSILFLCSGLFAFSQVSSGPGKTTPFVLGETVELQSSVLSEKRVLNIYLPDGYNANDTTRYPVVYLLDGGREEDFIHITGLYQFNSFPWVARVQPSIIVGIVNTDRLRDMTFPTRDTAARRRYPTSGHSDKFIAFLEKELQPFIQKRFRASAGKTLIGESLAGLLAAEVLLTKPALFNQYIIVSPSLWWDNGSLLDRPTAALQGALAGTAVYLASGKEGLMPGRQPRVMEVDVNVLADNIQSAHIPRLSVYFDYLPRENHATIMHQAVMNALLFLKAF